MFWAAIPTKISALTGFGNLCSFVWICGFPFFQPLLDFLLRALVSRAAPMFRHGNGWGQNARLPACKETGGQRANAEAL